MQFSMVLLFFSLTDNFNEIYITDIFYKTDANIRPLSDINHNPNQSLSLNNLINDFKYAI